MFSGPQVSIRIGDDGPTHKVSKDLICKQSPYFAAMFNGNFKEGETQETILTETYGIVSNSSLQSLIQYLYRGKVAFTLQLSSKDELWKAIEFARFGDMIGIHGISVDMASHIKSVICNSTITPFSTDLPTNVKSKAGILCKYVTSGHIVAAMELPPRNAVRDMIVAATVEGYMRCKQFKFRADAEEVPAYAADLLRAVRVALTTAIGSETSALFTDPVTETIVRFGENC